MPNVNLEPVRAGMTRAATAAADAGAKVKNSVATLGGKIRDVAVKTGDSIVEATTVRPNESVADRILSKAALSVGPAKPAEDASIVRKAVVTPFHYADKATAAIGTGVMHTTKAVQKTLDTVISSVATAIAMVVKAVAFVVTAIALPVIAIVGGTVALALGTAAAPFAASGLIVKHRKDKEIAALKLELAEAKRTTIVKAQEALQKAADAVKANAPSKATVAKVGLGAAATAAGAAVVVAGKLYDATRVVNVIRELVDTETAHKAFMDYNTSIPGTLVSPGQVVESLVEHVLDPLAATGLLGETDLRINA